MSTSRPIIPASPTAVGTTDDASRGGIFSRTNLANPISGADANGTIVNDSAITLSVSIDGTVQTGTFTTNQSTDGTVALVFTGVGNGSGTGGGGGDPVASGALSGNTITLTLQSGATVDIDVTDLATNAELTAAINALNIPTSVVDLTGNLGTAGQIVQVNSAGTALEFAAAPAATVSASSFSNTGNVDFTAGTGSTIQANYEGLSASGNNLTAIGSGVQGLNVTATGLNLSFDATTGILSITDPAPPPAAAAFTETFTAPTTNALSAVTAPTNVVTPASGTMIDSVTSTITGTVSGTPINVTGTATAGGNPIPAGGTTSAVDVTYPASTTGSGNYSSPGTYTVTTMTTATGPAGQRTSTETDTFTRFLPYFQLRSNSQTNPTATQLMAGETSTAAWPSNNHIVATSGTGLIIYVGVPASALSGTRVARLDDPTTGNRLNTALLTPQLTIADSSGTDIAYNVYRIVGSRAGASLFLGTS